jgi:ribosomal protein S18 acetylase RimI-like enzyme
MTVAEHSNCALETTNSQSQSVNSIENANNIESSDQTDKKQSNNIKLKFRRATIDDVAELHSLIELCYRGDTARKGWTYESDLIDTPRATRQEMCALLNDVKTNYFILAHRDDSDKDVSSKQQQAELIACVVVSQTKTPNLTYMGMLCVQPHLQTGGIGKQMISEAEKCAINHFNAQRMEMTVIAQRPLALRDYYVRRGYIVQKETRPFPRGIYKADRECCETLHFTVLAKQLVNNQS